MHPSKILLSVIAILATFIFPAQAQAAARWLGTNSSDWNDPANWSSEGADVPLVEGIYTTLYVLNGDNFHAILSSGTFLTAAQAVNVGMSSTYGELWLNGSAYFQTGALQIGRSTVGGKLVMSGSAVFSSTHNTTVFIGHESVGVLDMFENSSLIAKANVTIGAGPTASGTLLISDNAQLSTNGFMLIGGTNTTAAMASLGTALLSGSSRVTINRGLVVGNSGTGTLVINDAATLTTVESTTIAVGASSKGTLQLKGGVLVTTSITKGAGDGTLDLNGGTVRAAAASTNFFASLGNLTINGTGVAAGQSAFTFDTNGFNVTATNAFAYNGASDSVAFAKIGSGTLTLSKASAYAGATRVGAGTLKLNVANALASSSGMDIAAGAILDANGQAQTLNGLSGAGNVAAAGSALTLSNAANTVFSGTLNGMTSLTKTGTGALTLAANHSAFAGVTNVNAGSLILNGANARLGGTVNLAAGAGLGGNGTLAKVNTAGGSVITIGATHGAPSAETLTITGTLALVNNTTLRYDLFDGSNDSLIVGTLVRSGSSTIDLSSGLTGSYKLITATGTPLSLSDTSALNTTINSGALSGRTTASYSILNGNELWLDVASSNIADNKWSGTNTGSWKDNFANWQAADTLFIGGDSVIFDDTAAGTHTVSVDVDVHAADMTVDTATGYTFTGNYAISTSTVAPAAAGAEGKLTKTGAGALILANSGSNYFQHGIVLAGGTLQGNARTLGNADIANNAALIFDQAGAATYTAAITGNGSLAKINTGTLTLNNAANSYAGGISVAGGALELQNSGVATQGAVNIAAGAALRITNGASYTVQNALSGAGTLFISLDAPASAVSFTAAAGNAFAGTVRLGQSTLNLSGQNTSSLANTALQLAAGNVTTVGTGTQNIRSLSLDGGKLVFSVTIPPDTAAAGIISTNTLTLGTGTIQVSFPSDGAAEMPDANLLAQDDGAAVTRLINATTVTGSTGGLTLVDQDGHAVSAATARTVDITQGGSAVATGTYNYGFVTDGGLGVNFRLLSVSILDGQTLTLAPDAGATGVGTVFSAAIGGSGNLAINAANAPVTLAVASNYTGTTSITAGKLILGVNNALSQTVALDLSAGAEIDLNARSQTVGNLTTAAGSTLNFAGGSLKINTGGLANGVLTGAGALSIAGGTLAINGANTGLTASTTIANTAAVLLNNATGLGSGAITFGGTGSVLSLDISGADTMSNNLVSAATGAGQLIKAGGGTIAFTGDNSGFSGAVSIEAGRIIASGSSNLITGAKSITMGDDATLEYSSGGATPVTLAHPIVSTGTTGGLVVSNSTSIILTQTNIIPTVSVNNGSNLYVAASVANPFGPDAVVSVDATSGLVNRRASLAIPSLALSGTLWISDPAIAGTGSYGNVAIGRKLTSTGTGVIVFRTDLSRGLGDRLTLGEPAGVASNYKVIVNNTDTPNYWGVERLDIITGNDPQARFTLANEIASSTGYTYGLRQDGGTHYLYATDSLSHEADAVLNTAAVMSADWHFELDSLGSRMGDVRREFAASGGQRPGGNVWARGSAYHVDADAELGGYAFSQDAYGVTVGGDKAFRLGQNAHVLAGAFAGFTTIERSFDNRGDGSTDSLSAGLYITWFHKSGLYVDATVKMNKYDNDFAARDADGSLLSTAAYDNKACGASFEFGRLFQSRAGWWVEVAGQFAYAKIDEARFTTSTGSRVVIFDSEATQYRGSVRWGKIFKDRLSLWMKAALVGTNNDDGEVRFYGSDASLRADIDGLRMEAGLGANYALTKRSQVYFDYEYARADYYTRPWSFNLGYRLFW